MKERKIELFTEKQPILAKNNTRDLAIGIVLCLASAIVMAKMGVPLFVTMLVGLGCIGIPIIAIINRNNEYHEERTQKSIDALVKKYGEYSIKIDDSCIDYMTLLFPSAQVLVIHGMQFRFSEIIDFSLNEMASYKTTTSTSSMLGRGLVGGVMFGGIGALAGANSASSITVKENAQYNFNIILDDFNNPNFSCKYFDEAKANTLYSILKLIIDKNQKNEKDQDND